MSGTKMTSLHSKLWQSSGDQLTQFGELLSAWTSELACVTCRKLFLIQASFVYLTTRLWFTINVIVDICSAILNASSYRFRLVSLVVQSVECHPSLSLLTSLISAPIEYVKSVTNHEGMVVRNWSKSPQHVVLNIVSTPHLISHPKRRLVDELSRLLTICHSQGARRVTLYDFCGIMRADRLQLQTAVRSRMESWNIKVFFPEDVLPAYGSNSVDYCDSTFFVHVSSYVHCLANYSSLLTNIPPIDISHHQKEDSKADCEMAVDKLDLTEQHHVLHHFKQSGSPTADWPDADLMIRIGSSMSHLGYSPLQMHLAEIHSLPCGSLSAITDHELGTIFAKFSQCQQRFGK